MAKLGKFGLDVLFECLLKIVQKHETAATNTMKENMKQQVSTDSEEKQRGPLCCDKPECLVSIQVL